MSVTTCPARSTKAGQVILTCELALTHEGDHLDPSRIAWSEVPPAGPDPVVAMRRIIGCLGDLDPERMDPLGSDALAVAKELQRFHAALEREPLARVLLRVLSASPNGDQGNWLRAVRDAADAVRRLAGVPE